MGEVEGIQWIRNSKLLANMRGDQIKEPITEAEIMKASVLLLPGKVCLCKYHRLQFTSPT